MAIARWCALLLLIAPPFQEDRDRYELNDSLRTAKPIPLATDLAATIYPKGDRDYYRLDLPGPGVLRVILFHCPKLVDPVIAVFSPREKKLAEFNPWGRDRRGRNVVLDADIPEKGSYAILIHDGRGRHEDAEDNVASKEPYRFRVEFTPVSDTNEPNDSRETATRLEDRKPLSGTIFPRGDRDWFRYDVPKPGLGLLRVWLSEVAENVDPELEVETPDGRKLKNVLWGREQRGADVSWSVETWKPGPHFVRLRDGRGRHEDGEDDQRSVERYRVEASYLACKDDRDNRSLAAAAPLRPGETVTGAIFPTGTLRTYRIAVPAPGQGRLNVLVTDMPANIAPHLTLLYLKPGAKAPAKDDPAWRKKFDAWCADTRTKVDLAPFETVAYFHPWGQEIEGRPVCLSANLTRSGDYYLVLRDGRARHEDGTDDQSGLGLFKLWVAYSGVADPNEPNGTLAEARQIEWDRPVSVLLFPQKDVDLFRFALDRPAQVDAIAAGIPSGLRPRIVLLDAGGKEIRGAWRAGSHAQAVTTLLKTAGKYFLSIRDGGNGASKEPFVVLLHREPVGAEEPAEPNDTVARATELRRGKSIQAQIFPGHDVDWYAVAPPGPGRMQFLLTDLPGGTSTRVELLAGDGKTALLRESSRQVSNPLIGRNMLLTWEVRKGGKYYLRVGEERGGPISVRPYGIRYEFFPAALKEGGTNDSIPTAVPLSDLRVTDELFPRTDRDFYKVQVKAKGTLAVYFHNPGGIRPRLQLGEKKPLAQVYTSPEEDGYLRADGVGPGDHVLSVEDAAWNAGSKRASLLPYELSRRLFLPSDWETWTAAERGGARPLELRKWAAIALSAKDKPLWIRLSVPGAAKVGLLVDPEDPKNSAWISLFLKGGKGEWKGIQVSSYGRSSRSGTSMPSWWMEKEGEVYLRLQPANSKADKPPRFFVYSDYTPAPKFGRRSFDSPAHLKEVVSLEPLGPGAETWLAADSEGRGRVRILLDGFSDPRSVMCDMYFGPRALGVRPKILHALGGFAQTSPADLFPDIRWETRRSGSGATIPVDGFSVLLLESVGSYDFELAKPETGARLLEFAERGGRVVLLAPRGRMSIFGVRFVPEGRVRDRTGSWEGAEKAGFSVSAREGKAVVAAEKKVGKGVVVLDARALTRFYRFPSSLLFAALGVSSRLREVGRGLTPFSVEWGGGGQVLEVPVPEKGRLYVRVKGGSRNGILGTWRASAEFLPGDAEEKPAALVSNRVTRWSLPEGTGSLSVPVVLGDGEAAQLFLLNRSAAVRPRLTLHEEIRPLAERPKVLLLTRRTDDEMERRYPGIEFIRGTLDDPLRFLKGCHAVLVDRVYSPGDFRLNDGGIRSRLRDFVGQGGRVVFVQPSYRGVIWGGKLESIWKRQAISVTPEMEKILPGIKPAETWSSGTVFRPDPKEGFLPLVVYKTDPKSVVVAGKRIGKGMVLLDLLPREDNRLHAELALSPTYRWIQETDAGSSRYQGGAFLLELAPRKGTRYSLRLDVLENEREPGRVHLLLVRKSRQEPFEPNDDFTAATAIESGKEVRANIRPRGDRDFFEIAAPESGILDVAVLNVPSHQDLRVQAYWTAAGTKRLKPFPTILYLVGGRKDYNLDTRYSDLRWTRINYDEPGAKTWLSLLPKTSTVVMDGLTSLAQFGMDRGETYERIERFVKGGGRFILLCPQDISSSLVGAQLGGSVVSASSQWDGNWGADKVIDGKKGGTHGGLWCSGKGAKPPHSIVFRARNGEEVWFDRVVLHANTRERGQRVKDFEVLATSGTDPKQGPWKSLGKFVSKETDRPQAFSIPRQKARYFKLVVWSNYGKKYTYLGEFEVLDTRTPLLFGLAHTGTWTDEALRRSPAAEAGFPPRARGPVNGWASADAHGEWWAWKEVGFEPLWLFSEGRAATVFRRLGKGTLIADTQEIGHSSNTAGNWKIYELLETVPQIRPLGIWNGTQADYAGLGSEAFRILVNEPGTVVLVVDDLRGQESGETYYLKAAFRPQVFPFEPNDEPRQATSVPPGKDVSLALETASDVDWLTFLVRSEGVLHVRLSGVSPRLDPELFLHHASDLERPLERRHYTQPHTRREEAAVFRVTRPGNYFVRIQDQGRNGGTPEPFTLRVWLDPRPAFETPNRDAKTARPLRPGDQHVSIHAGDRGSWFRFKASKPGELRVDLLAPMPLQDPAAALYRAEDPRNPPARFNREGRGGSESFRTALPKAGEYLLQVYEAQRRYGSLARWTLRASWPGMDAIGPLAVHRIYPPDRSTLASSSETIEIGFDRLPDKVRDRISVVGTRSGAVPFRVDGLPFEAAVRIVPERPFAPEETVTVRVRLGAERERVSVFTVAPEFETPGRLVPTLQVFLPRGRILAAGSHAVVVRSNSALAKPPRLRYLPKGGSAVDIPLRASADPRQWEGVLEIAKGTPEGTAVFEGAADFRIAQATRQFEVDTTPPPAPRDLVGRSLPRGSVELRWAGTEDAVRYAIYREGKKLPEPVSGTRFVDLPPADGEIRYRISAIDAAGNEGAPGPEIRAVSDRVPPDFIPKRPEIVVDGKSVLIKWDGMKGVNYNLYRDRAPISEVQKLQLTPIVHVSKGAAYVDRPRDGKWHYAVCARDAAGNLGALSPSREILLDTTGPVARVDISSKSPLGPGNHALTLRFSEPLREAPRLWITPHRKKPAAIPLKEVKPNEYAGILSIARGFGEGRATFRVAASDRNGNPAGETPEKTASVLIDTQGPSVRVRRKGFPKVGPRGNTLIFEPDEALSRLAAQVRIGERKPIRLAPRRISELEYSAAFDLPGDVHPAKIEIDIDCADVTKRAAKQTLSLEADTRIPSAPADVVALPLGDKRIEVRWSAIPEEVSYYRLYRAASERELSRRRIADRVKETSHIDSVTEERVYFYAVSCVDLAGNESALSAPYRIVADITPTGPPELKTVSVDRTATVRLAWTPPGGAKAVTVNVYRDVRPFSSRLGRKPIALRLLARETADVPKRSGKYYYAVSAVDGSGNESRLSPARSVSFVQNRPTASIRTARPSPIRESVRVTIETSKPLARPPELAVLFSNRQSIVLPVTKGEGGWRAVLPVTKETPNGPARFVYHGESTDGISGEIILDGEDVVIDTLAPGVTVSLEPAGVLRPGPVSVRLRGSEPLAQSPELTVVVPGKKPALVTLAPAAEGDVEYVGRLEIPEGTPDGIGLFRVVATDRAGNRGDAIHAGATFTVDSTPPRSPAALEAKSLSKGRVRLTWQAPRYGPHEASEALRGYNVYRDRTPIKEVKEKRPIAMGLRHLEYVDAPPKDGPWFYAVCAVDLAGLESPPISRRAESDRVAPASPSIAAIELAASRTRIALTWKPGTGESPAAFRLYRSTQPIRNLRDLRPVGSDLGGDARRAEEVPPDSGRYYYAVTALDAVGNESGPARSEPMEFVMLAPVARITLPTSHLAQGKYPFRLRATKPLVRPPVVKVFFAGRKEGVAIDLQGSGIEWKGTLEIRKGTPDGTARFSFQGAAQVGSATVEGDRILSGESFTVDATPPTAELRFEKELLARDGVVVLPAGRHAFVLAAGESVRAAPSLFFVPRKGERRALALRPAGPRRWEGVLEIGSDVVEGAGYVEFGAIDLAGNRGNRLTAGGHLIVDRTPPKAVDPLQVVAHTKGRIRLGWNRAGEEGDVRFQVFRSHQSFKEVSRLSPIADKRFILAYLDQPSQDGEYYYAVRVIDDAGNVGALSEVVKVYCDRRPPDPPSDLKATEANGVFHLTWKAPGSETPFVYHAYYADRPLATVRGARTLGKNIPGKFTEIYGAPEENGTYYICMTAVDEALNESSPSKSVRVEVRRFGALSRIHILRALESRMEKKLKPGEKRVNRVRPGRYRLRVVTSKLLKEAPILSFVPKGSSARPIPLQGAGKEWTGNLEVDEGTPEEAAYFRISTVDTDGVTSDQILEGEYVVVDRTPPKAPPHFVAKAMTEDAQGSIRLTWKTPVGEVPHFYRVYRSAKAPVDGAPGQRVGLVRVRYENESRYEFRDLPPNDGDWTYSVTSLDLAGNESAPTKFATATSRTKAPRATIRLYTKASGDEAANVVGADPVRVVLQTSHSIEGTPSLAYRRTGAKRVDPVPIPLGRVGEGWEGRFQVPPNFDDGSFEFQFRAKASTGEEGTFIARGKEFRVDRRPPMAEILIPGIAKLEVQLNWEGTGKHKLDTPPVGVGAHDLQLTVLRDMPDDERRARWAKGDAGDLKDLVGPPRLAFRTSDGKVYPIPVRGLGARWYGRMTITPEMAQGPAEFVFEGTDRFGNATKKLAPVRRWHVVDEMDMSDHPRVVANYATTGGKILVDTRPPGAPDLKRLVVRKLGTVEIGWAQPKGEPPATYRVYRSNFPIVPGSQGKPIKAGVLAKVWVDAPPRDGDWFFAVTAVDLAGNEGPLSNSMKVFVDSIKPELKITPVPSGEDFVILEVESDQPVVSLELKFPGRAQKQAILGGDSGRLIRRGNKYVFRQKLPLPQLQEVFNGKVEVVVHSPDPTGNVVSTTAPLAAQKISSATGGSVESTDGEVKLVVPPGVKPIRSKARTQRVVDKDAICFISYAHIPKKTKHRVQLPCTGEDLAGAVGIPKEEVEAILQGLRPGTGMGEPLPEELLRDAAASLGKEIEIVPAGASGKRRRTDVDPLPPEVEVVGKPYVININQPPEEPMELKGAATQADLSGIREVSRLMMKIPKAYRDQYSDSAFLEKKIKVLAWNPAPEGGKKGRWEVVDRVQLDPVTKELIVPAEKVTTYVIVSERTPPTITEHMPTKDEVIVKPLKEIRCKVVDKGTGVAVGAENRVKVWFDGKPVDDRFVKLGEGDPTEVTVNVALEDWLKQARPETQGILPPGRHRIRVRAEDIVENVAVESWDFTFDDRAPEIRGVHPADGSIVRTARPIVTARLLDDARIDPATIAVRIGGESAPPEWIFFDAAGQTLVCRWNGAVAAGRVPLEIDVKDNAGKAAETFRGTIVVDLEGPSLLLEHPAPGRWARSNEVTVRCLVQDLHSGVAAEGLSLYVDGKRVAAAFDGSRLRGTVRVGDGEHSVEVVADDRAGNRTRGRWRFSADPRGPIFFDLGATDRLALRIVDFESGLDPETLRVEGGMAYRWEPSAGVLVADRAVRFSIADRAGNRSEFAGKAIPISELAHFRKRAPEGPAEVSERPPRPAPSEPKPSSSPALLVLAGLAVLGAAAGGLLWWRRRMR